MRAGLIVSGVLGLGTALTFGAAALVASAFPNGTSIAAGSNGTFFDGKGPAPMQMPAPAPMQVPVTAPPMGGPAVTGDPVTDGSPAVADTPPPAP
jgi:hypothetical protein